MFCDVIIDPGRPLANYKLLDDIMLELAGNLKIQQLQAIVTERWNRISKPYVRPIVRGKEVKRRRQKTQFDRNLPE